MANNGDEEVCINPSQNDIDTEVQAAIDALWLSSVMAFPMTLRSAVELGIIDAIYGDGSGVWLSPSEIADRLPQKLCCPDAPALLDRVLRLLATYSVLRRRTIEGGALLYGAGAVCKFLVENQDSGSVRALFLASTNRFSFERWSQLSNIIKEGGLRHEEMVYEHIKTDRMWNKRFDEMLSGHTKLIMNKALEVYNGFEGLNVVVDVGGGVGTALSLIIAKYRHIRGVNFDQPDTVASLLSYPGIEHVGGDMFVSIPKGDAIFMKSILHNWSDEQCLKILKNCWEALPDHGKVILVESIIRDEDNRNDVYSKTLSHFDVGMMVQLPGGKERTLAELQALAEKSGFLGPQIACAAYTHYVMELHKDLIFKK